MAQTFTLLTPDGPMDAYEATPEGEIRGGIVVIQEAFGVNDHIQSICDRLAAEGYQAIAPHLFHRAGGGTAPYDDFSQVLPLFEGLTDDALLMDVDAALEHLRASGHDDHRIGTVGFCMGGRVTFLIAARRALGAAVGFYGGGIVTARFPQFPALVGEASALQTPWLGLFGDQDGGIPVDDVEALRTALQGASVETQIVRYPDADHGFHCDVRASYHPESAADAWTRTLDWFHDHLHHD